MNPEYIQVLEKNGMRFSGRCCGRDLMEIVELSGHPFFIGCQFHPEFKSRPEEPAPLFAGLVAAALEKRKGQV